MTDFAKKYAFVLDDSDDDSPVVVQQSNSTNKYTAIANDSATASAFFAGQND